MADLKSRSSPILFLNFLGRIDFNDSCLHNAPMVISFRDIDFSTDDDCKILANWLNQDVSVLSPASMGGNTTESVRNRYLTILGKNGFGAFFLCVNGKPIGYASYFLDPSHKLSKEKVVWPSLAIGVHEYRRKGFVSKIEEEISRRATKLGATHIEAGVFTSNLPMVKLLKKHGFSEIGRQLVGPARIDSIHFIKPVVE